LRERGHHQRDLRDPEIDRHAHAAAQRTSTLDA
jgi:hypothetical protein